MHIVSISALFDIVVDPGVTYLLRLLAGLMGSLFVCDLRHFQTSLT
jgi:hypothetical protein